MLASVIPDEMPFNREEWTAKYPPEHIDNALPGVYLELTDQLDLFEDIKKRSQKQIDALRLLESRARYALQVHSEIDKLKSELKAIVKQLESDKYSKEVVRAFKELLDAYRDPMLTIEHQANLARANANRMQSLASIFNFEREMDIQERPTDAYSSLIGAIKLGQTKGEAIKACMKATDASKLEAEKWWAELVQTGRVLKDGGTWKVQPELGGDW